MSALQEQAVSMIGKLSDDNVSFLIEIMNRFMNVPVPDSDKKTASKVSHKIFMDDMETMRKKAKGLFPADFDSTNIC